MNNEKTQGELLKEKLTYKQKMLGSIAKKRYNKLLNYAMSIRSTLMKEKQNVNFAQL